MSQNQNIENQIFRIRLDKLDKKTSLLGDNGEVPYVGTNGIFTNLTSTYTSGTTATFTNLTATYASITNVDFTYITASYISSTYEIYTGEIGINTVAPATPLHLGGSTNKSIRIDSDNSNAAFYGAWQDYALIGINRDPATGNIINSSKAASDVALYSANGDSRIIFETTKTNNIAPTERMRITGDGYVGINIANPARQLSVNGQLSVVSGAVGEDLAYNGNIISTKVSTANQHINLVRAANHVRSIGYAPGSNTFLIAGGEETDSNFGNSIPFSIDSAGKVGIGTIIPSNKQHVVVGNADGIRIESSNAGFLEIGKTGGQRWRWYGEYTANNQLELVTAGGGSTPSTSVMTILSNGYVGVATTSPTVTLDVSGAIKAGRTSTTEGGEIQFGRGFDNALKWYIDTNGSGDSSNLRIIDNSASVALFIESVTRDIGIGTTIPNTKLDVRSTTTAATQGTYGIGVGTTTTTDLTLGADSSAAYIQTWNSKPLSINSQGNNVGINLTNPATKLDVGGTIRSSRNDSSLEGGQYELCRAFDNTTKWTIDAYGSGDNSNLRIFDNSGTVGFVMNAVTRNVGIGDNVNPVNKLFLQSSVANDGIYLNGNSSLWTSLRTNLGAGAYNSITNANDRGIIYGGSVDGTPGGGFVISPWATGPSGIRLDAAGNVGIKTSTANLSYALDISGDTRASGDLTVNGGDLIVAASTFNLAAAATTLNIGASSTTINVGGNLTTTRFDTNTLYVDGTNNRVYVGHTSGSAKLSVSASTTAGLHAIEAIVQNVNLNENPSYTNGVIKLYNGASTGRNAIDFTNYDSPSLIAASFGRSNSLYGNGNANAPLADMMYIDFKNSISNTNGFFVSNDNLDPDNVVFFMNSHGLLNTRPILINDAGVSNLSGPEYPLHVTSSTNELAHFRSTDSTEDAYIRVVERANRDVVLGSTAGTGFVGSSTNTGFALRTNNTNRWLIATNGLFAGDGTTHKIFLSGSTIGTDWATNANAELGINRTGFAFGTTQTRDLNIYDGRDASIGIFKGSTKYFGIGTLTPSASLHVKQNGGSINIEGTDHTYIQWYPDGFAAGRKAYTGYPSALVNDFYIVNEILNADIIMDPNGGNVGIDNTNPIYKLDVNGSLRATADSVINNNQIFSDNITINGGGSGNRYAYVDFVGDATYTDYGLRVIRNNGGANTSSEIVHRGTGNFIITAGVTSGEISNLIFYVNGDYRQVSDSAGDFRPYYTNNSSLGNTTFRWQDLWLSNTTINPSDEREKFDIFNSDLGLEFIKKLRPVSYKWKSAKTIVSSSVTFDDVGNKIVNNSTSSLPGKRNHYGLIAQEVEQVLNGKDFAGFIRDQETDVYALRYGEFISPIIKAVQELSEENNYLKNKLEEKENQINNILSRLSALEDK